MNCKRSFRVDCGEVALSPEMIRLALYLRQAVSHGRKVKLELRAAAGVVHTPNGCVTDRKVNPRSVCFAVQ